MSATRERNRNAFRFMSVPPLRSSFEPELEQSGQRRRFFWDAKFATIVLVIVLLMIVAAYLQYSVYPSVMANNFGETLITVHFSFLTYTIDAVRCGIPTSCVTIDGLPAFDFFQLFGIALLLILAYHFIRNKKV